MTQNLNGPLSEEARVADRRWDFSYEGFSPSSGPQTIQRQWPSYDPIMKVTDAKMRCNGGTSAPLNATVKAGDSVVAKWKQWTHEQGPVMVWLYKCAGDFKSCDGSQKGWFKIDQMGMTAPPLSGKAWGNGIIYSKKQWESKIPASLAPGNYLIRHELIALHQANTPQFYPECAQITVTGSGTASPGAAYLASIPGYAPQNDPGITVSLPRPALFLSSFANFVVEIHVTDARIQVDTYASGATTYKCPGPDVWTGAAAAKKARDFTA